MAARRSSRGEQLPDPRLVVAESEAIILALGGKVCEALPYFGHEDLAQRASDVVSARALVCVAVAQLAFDAPTDAVWSWLERHDLTSHLSVREASMLRRSRDELSEQELIDCSWYLEPGWALLWAGSMIDALPLTEPVGSMAPLCPSIEDGESPAAFQAQFRLRPYSELYRALDVYYRAHWHVRESRLCGESSKPFDEGVVMERRKALQWTLEASSDWDDMDLST